MTVGIYKITCLKNNKSYIGQSVHIERRWIEHCQPQANSAIALSIKKYGKNNFSFKIIEECLLEELDEKEQYWINYYSTLAPNGYNIINVGEHIYHTSSINSVYRAEQIIEDILYSSLTFNEISKKYNTSTRTITRINQGYTFHNDDLSYPLRKHEKQEFFCIDCGKMISHKAVRCFDCEHIKQRKVKERPTRDYLKNLIRNNSFLEISRIYNVSDNTIRKWCKNYNLPFRSKDIKAYSENDWAGI